MAVENDSDGNTDGTILGQSSTDKLGFYGKAPIVRRSSSDQATSLLASSVDFAANQTANLIEIMNTFTALGLWKGSA